MFKAKHCLQLGFSPSHLVLRSRHVRHARDTRERGFRGSTGMRGMAAFPLLESMILVPMTLLVISPGVMENGRTSPLHKISESEMEISS